MNREQKAAAIEEIAGQIQESEAVFAVDYRGITVAQSVELRTKLRDADATFRVTKNTLTERAADQADAPVLKPFLAGPTALTFVRGDVAAAAKAVADFNKETDLLAFKGGLMNGEGLDAAQIQALAKLPSRQVLYGQLVGLVASPITGVARGLNALISGVAIALGQVAEKKASGELPAGDPPAAAAEEAPAAEAEAPAEETPAEETPAETPAAEADAPAEDTPAEEPAAQADAPADDAPAAEAEAPADDSTNDTDQTDASA
jgi:large subunit ribosomal protein L10